MDWSEILIPESNLIERDLGDEIVIMSQDDREIHSFEDTAFWIWKRIKEGATPEIIISRLTEEYDIEEEQARHDLINFIEDLQLKGIIKNPRRHGI